MYRNFFSKKINYRWAKRYKLKLTFAATLKEMHTPRWSPPELFTVRLRWDSNRPTNSNHKQATHRQCLSCFWVYVTCYGKRYSSKYWANICFEHYFVSTKSISLIKKGYLYTPYKSKTSRKSNNNNVLNQYFQTTLVI